MYKILVIEDDFMLAGSIKKQLELENYEVENIYDGLLAKQVALRQNFDCIILDVKESKKSLIMR